jgi:hypothetical protein
MSDDDEWTPGDVTRGLAVPHEPLISEDNWVKPTFA